MVDVPNEVIEIVREPFATVIVKFDVVAVALFISVTLIARVDDPTVVGVPEMTPVAEASESPAGNEPEETAKERGVAPPEATSERV